MFQHLVQWDGQAFIVLATKYLPMNWTGTQQSQPARNWDQVLLFSTHWLKYKSSLKEQMGRRGLVYRGISGTVHAGNGLMGLPLFIATGGVESQTILEATRIVL